MKWSLILTGILVLAFLILTRLEGWICCVMALPIIILFVLPGALIGHWVRKRMDKVEADKPFLIRIGLPTPVRCELRGECVGGKRICIFDQGRIEQEVTGWDPPRSLTTRITGNSLPGRRWLGFRTASYGFRPVEGGTEVTRKSEISSRLYPRWYWRPLEAWGVQSEHDYVLSSVRRNSVTRNPPED